jgi:dihydropteroate synthase
VALEEELRRVVPVFQALHERSAVPLSVDTSKAEVAQQCLAAGAHLVNDVTALAGDPHMAEVVRASGAGLMLMHMQGTPATMQQQPQYADVVTEIAQFFQERLQFAAAHGIASARVVLDPGIGFGKTLEHNLEILARLQELQQLGCPLGLGVSRKGFLGRVLNRPVDQRLAGSLAVACLTATRGTVQVLRVHDVAATRDAVHLIEVIRSIEEQRASR